VKKDVPIHAPGCAIASEIATLRSLQLLNLPETIEQEDGMVDGELASAGAVYALAHGSHREAERATVFNWFWPWQSEAFGLSTHRATLLHAASLLVAEIERIDRAAAKVEQAQRQAATPMQPHNHILDGDGAEPMKREGDE